MDLKGTVVFSSGKSADFDIWTLALESGKLRQLTHGAELNDSPRWSPDGARIAYIAAGADGIFSVWVMERDGKNKQQLTTGIHCAHPAWAPDGSRIVFAANAADPNEFELCSVECQTKQVDVLFRRPGIESGPSISPDGSSVLFAGVDPNSDLPFSDRDTEIWEYDTATKTERRICAHPARDYSPVYSPDGTKIAFVSHRNGRSEEEYAAKLHEIRANLNLKDRKSVDSAIRALAALDRDSDIYVVDTTGENLRKITRNEGSDTSVRWSPCGNFLVFASAPKDEAASERLHVAELATGKVTALQYDRSPLAQEIGANAKGMLDNNILMRLIPNFIERPLKMRAVGSAFWGEEREPDWTYAS
ncbi:MAG: PD40 domain-containing protein [Bdellovibrionales bacterium]|nr:PD40 domain-containing protein [Bdellovibrionales bacterium]